MSDFRPTACANIYKHGRLKTIDEMIEDGTTTPILQELADRIKKLTEGIEINLDEPLNEEDE